MITLRSKKKLREKRTKTKEQRDMAEGLKKYRAWQKFNEKLTKLGWT